MAEVVLRVGSVGKTFATDGGRSRLRVLDAINLDIARGEFVSLVGPSGCGKTTLLKMMVGLVRCEEGQILLRDAPVKGIPQNIGFVFQEPALLPWQSVYRNVALALEAKHMSSGEKRIAVERYLELTGLADFADFPPYQLSGGMQRRVAIARGLVGSPDVLLMDEPFVALDALTRGKLQADLATIVEETGITVVLVTHDVDEALFLSDRIAVFSARPGRLLELIAVPLSRPRRMKEFRLEPAVAQLRDQVYELIESQDMGQSSGDVRRMATTTAQK